MSILWTYRKNIPQRCVQQTKIYRSRWPRSDCEKCSREARHHITAMSQGCTSRWAKGCSGRLGRPWWGRVIARVLAVRLEIHAISLLHVLTYTVSRHCTCYRARATTPPPRSTATEYPKLWMKPTYSGEFAIPTYTRLVRHPRPIGLDTLLVHLPDSTKLDLCPTAINNYQEKWPWLDKKCSK